MDDRARSCSTDGGHDRSYFSKVNRMFCLITLTPSFDIFFIRRSLFSHPSPVLSLPNSLILFSMKCKASKCATTPANPLPHADQMCRHSILHPRILSYIFIRNQKLKKLCTKENSKKKENTKIEEIRNNKNTIE